MQESYIGIFINATGVQIPKTHSLRHVSSYLDLASRILLCFVLCKLKTKVSPD